MPQVKIIYDSSVQAYKVRVPYSKEFLDAMRQLIPVANRMWDPLTKTWTVSEAFGLPIKSLCDRVWGSTSVMFIDAAHQQSHSANQTQTPIVRRNAPLDEVLLTFVKLLPYNAARKAYLFAAQELHPDKQGGDSTKMTSINAAWTRIEQEFYRKGASNA